MTIGANLAGSAYSMGDIIGTYNYVKDSEQNQKVIYFIQKGNTRIEGKNGIPVYSEGTFTMTGEV